jgi:hypothetical protein
MANWNILLKFEKFHGHLVDFVSIWYIFPVFGITYQEKSGNPVLELVSGKHGNSKIGFLYCRSNEIRVNR